MYLTFGFASSKLENDALVYDFGMRTSAVLIAPDSIRSTDSLEPGVGRRRRTQLPRSSEVNTFGLDARTALMKGLVGKPIDTVNKKISQITGGAHLKISSDANPEELYYVLVHLLRSYLNGKVPAELENYLQVRPVDDPILRNNLEDKLIKNINNGDLESTAILIPDTVEYGTRDHVKFTGLGHHKPFDDVYIGSLHAYINEKAAGRKIDSATFNKMKLIICDDDGKTPESYPLNKCLFFESEDSARQSTFYFSEGLWYEVSRNLIKHLENRLIRFFEENDFPSFDETMKDEADYNSVLCKHLGDAIVLDKEDTLPWSRSKVEPCDIAHLKDGKLTFFHVKRKTTSATLSHLFNQGVNPWRIIRDDADVRKKFLELCEKGGLPVSEVRKAIVEKAVHIKYVITTHKDLKGAEKNLPIFSRLSADRIVTEAQDIGAEVSFTYVREPKDEALTTEDGDELIESD